MDRLLAGLGALHFETRIRRARVERMPVDMFPLMQHPQHGAMRFALRRLPSDAIAFFHVALMVTLPSDMTEDDANAMPTMRPSVRASAPDDGLHSTGA